MLHRRYKILALIFLVGILATQTNAQVSINCFTCELPVDTARAPVDLGIYPAYAPYGGSVARGINNSGAIGGYSYPPTVPGDPEKAIAGVTVGFVREKGVTQLIHLQNIMSYIAGVTDTDVFYGSDWQGRPALLSRNKKGNKWKVTVISESQGQVNGGSLNGLYFAGEVASSSGLQAFLYSDKGLTILANTFGGAGGSAKAVNDLGHVTGWFMNQPGDKRAFYIGNSGPALDLGIMPGPWSMGNDIDNCDQVAVSSEDPAYWNPVRGLEPMCRPLVAKWGHTYGIRKNMAAGVLGIPDQFDGGGGAVAVYWKLGKGFRLNTVGGLRGVAYGLNDLGDVVGKSNNGGGQDRATLWAAP